MQKARSISVFFPAYNDEKTIGALVNNALALLATLTDDYEVLVINDGSQDQTAAILDRLALESPHVRVIHHSENRGYGGALRTGFENARKDLIFYTDGDGQYDVNELAVLHELLTDEVDVVNGYKVKRADKLHRKVIGGLYSRVARAMFRLPIRDVDCDFRLIRQTALRRVNLTSSSGTICVELVRKLHASGASFIETPVNHYPRLHGRSQFFTIGRVARTAKDFGALWLRLFVFKDAPPAKKLRSVEDVEKLS